MEKPTFKFYYSIDAYGWATYLLQRFLTENKGKEVVIEVNSPGGSVDQAIVIQKLLQGHGNVTVRFVGMCASAVTWMAFGAKCIEIYDDSFWMCHRSSITVDIYRSMKVDDIDRMILQLQSQKKTAEAVDLMIIQKYYQRSQAKNKTIEQVISLMNEERFMSAAEALEWGFVDTVIPATKQSHVNAVSMIVQNCAQQGLPLPQTIDLDALKRDLEAEHDDGLLAKFLRSLTAAFRPKASNQEEVNTEDATASEDTIINPNPTNEMNIKFVLINALLAVAGFEVSDGKVTLTEDQMQKLEDALADAKIVKDAHDAAVQTLDGISENVKSIEGLNNKVLAVKAVLDRTPAFAPAGAGVTAPQKSEQEKKQEAIDNSAKDPVNGYARTL